MSIDPALGLEFGYTDLVLLGWAGNFQNVQQLDNYKKVGFQPNIGLGFKYKGIQIDYAFNGFRKSKYRFTPIFSHLK
jgi:hypothetical protein